MFDWGTLHYLYYPCLVDGLYFQYSLVLTILSLFSVLIFSWFSSSISSVVYLLPLFIIIIAHFSITYSIGPFSRECRIHRLHLCRRVRPHPNESPVYETLWWCDSRNAGGLRESRAPFTQSLSGPVGPGMEAPDRVLSMGQIDLNCARFLNQMVWNRTVFDIRTDYLC